MENPDIIILSEIEPEYDFFEELVTIEEQKGPCYETHNDSQSYYGATGPTGYVGATGCVGATGPKGIPGFKHLSSIVIGSSNSISSEPHGPQNGQFKVYSSNSGDWNNSTVIGDKNSNDVIENATVIGGDGGLTKLVAHGAQDAYLTGNPQVTFFANTQSNISGGYFTGMVYSN